MRILLENASSLAGKHSSQKFAESGMLNSHMKCVMYARVSGCIMQVDTSINGQAVNWQDTRPATRPITFWYKRSHLAIVKRKVGDQWWGNDRGTVDILLDALAVPEVQRRLCAVLGLWNVVRFRAQWALRHSWGVTWMSSQSTRAILLLYHCWAVTDLGL